LDRNGVELAISVDTYTVSIFARELKSVGEAATSLASVLPVSRDEIIARIGDRTGYFPIYKNLEPNLAVRLEKLAIPGVVLEGNYHRYYPQKTLASNLIGFTGQDQHGLEGIEFLYDQTLRGYPGLAVQEGISISSSGPARMRIVTPPMGGSNINLTIDSFIQHTLERELEDLVKKYDPIDAVAVAMDPHSGEILGMACLPSYDLNNFGVSKAEHRRNRPVTDSFEPGSCIKICAVASAVEAGKADHGTRFYCRGYGELDGRRIKCHGAHGLVDLDKAIAESCNAAMAQISQMVDKNTLFRTYKLFGFGDTTGIEAPGEITGVLNPPSRWSGFSAASLCFGQELTTTAVQLVAAYSAIANGGIMVKPHLLKRISSPDNDISQEIKPVQVRRVISAETAKWLRKMLLGVVEDGTGDLARLEDYTLGGKTSTAQKANPRGGYYNEKVVTSFIGMSPAMNPKIVLYVGVNEPKGDEKTLFGGKVAAPYFARMLDRVLKHMKVPPDRKTSLAARHEQLQKIGQASSANIIQLPNKLNERAELQTAKIELSSETVPDLKGFSLKKAIRILNDLGLKGIFEGNGIVVTQSPPPGTPVPDSKILMVKLSPEISN
ncbi:MAG: penicillin-binding transpeptidase domain-containing protein, partial [Candidatus Riflebacteria bacterium]